MSSMKIEDVNVGQTLYAPDRYRGSRAFTVESKTAKQLKGRYSGFSGYSGVLNSAGLDGWYALQSEAIGWEVEQSASRLRQAQSELDRLTGMMRDALVKETGL